MKFTFAMIALLFAATLNTPAFAQDWDMQPAADAVPSPSQEYRAAVAQPALEVIEAAQSSIPWDMHALHVSHPGNTTYETGALENVPHTTGMTGKQLISTLPVCATHTLSRISGPTNANGLPPCTMDGFVNMAGGNAFKIYGDEGTDGPPPLTDFQSINSGITGGSAAGLTTGQSGN